jgi:hypothetical protein
LLCCSSTSFDRTISSLSRLFENSPCSSDTRPRSYRSNSHSPPTAYRCSHPPVAGRSSANYFCFLTVARGCYCYFLYYWSRAGCVLAGRGECGDREWWAWASYELWARKRANLRAWICFSYFRRLIWRESSMREVTYASLFSAACNCCSRYSSLHRR